MQIYISKIRFLLRAALTMGPVAVIGHRIFLGPSSRIKRSKLSKLKLAGNLWFGVAQMSAGNFLTGSGSSMTLEEGAEFQSYGNTTIGSASTVWLYKNSKMQIGSRSYINMGAKIFIRTKLTIGNECAIAMDVKILDDDFHPVIPLERKGDYFPSTPRPIVIEDHVWIGANTTILKGVTIGSGSIVAAGSVVTSDVAPNCMVGGVPAKKIKENVTWIL